MPTDAAGVVMIATPMSLLTPQRLESLAAAAVAAPSADNHHVVRIAALDDRLQLLATAELAQAPTKRRLLGLISVGAVAENLVLRGRRLGLQLEPHWQLRGGDGALLAQFDCREMPPANDPLEQAITQRHTNRKVRFRGPLLAPQAQQQLADEAAGVEGTALAWLDEPERRRRALRLIGQAETERFRNLELHRELFESIRFDVGWQGAADQGLPPGALELPWFERPTFALLRHWPVQKIANLAGTHRFIGLRAAVLPCRLAPHLCAITAEGELQQAAIHAGRALQRVWLRATTLNLSFQVFAAAALYSIPGLDAVPASLARNLAAGWEQLCPGAQPFIVFRMGHASPASMRAGRPPAHSLLTTLAAG